VTKVFKIGRNNEVTASKYMFDSSSNHSSKTKDTINTLIQVVDDEFDIVNVIRIYLQGRGLNALGFTDPLLALEHFKVNCKNYSLVISDIRMPGMNGFEYVRKVRDINPEIKVLLMSAFEINSAELSAGLKGDSIEAFIQKPIPLDDLGSIVQAQLKTKVMS
jgi:DNA-binding NtrC family response regulator